MAGIGASLEYTSFTDEVIMFNNKDEVNTFFSNIRVLAGTPATYGSFKQSSSVSFSASTLVIANYADIQLDEVTLVQCPTKASFDELKTAFNTLQTSYNDLLTKLRNAGIIALS